MSKASRKLFSTIYENDILSLDTIDQLEEVLPLKANRSIKQAKKENKIQAAGVKSKSATATAITKSVVTKPVNATCNKCDNKIVGELIGDLYIVGIDKMVPLISYICNTCGHTGRRSVITLALPLAEYERKYFA